MNSLCMAALPAGTSAGGLHNHMYVGLYIKASVGFVRVKCTWLRMCCVYIYEHIHVYCLGYDILNYR